jgi:hypothetical protein
MYSEVFAELEPLLDAMGPAGEERGYSLVFEEYPFGPQHQHPYCYQGSVKEGHWTDGLPAETYAIMSKTGKFYARSVAGYFPPAWNSSYGRHW